MEFFSYEHYNLIILKMEIKLKKKCLCIQKLQFNILHLDSVQVHHKIYSMNQIFNNQIFIIIIRDNTKGQLVFLKINL